MNAAVRILQGLGAHLFPSGIRQRLAAGFGIVLLCLVLITGLSDRQLTGTVHALSTASSLHGRIATMTGLMKHALGNVQISLLNTSVLTEPDDVAYERKAIGEAMTQYRTTADALGGLLASIPDNQALKAQLDVVANDASSTLRLLDSVASQLGDPTAKGAVGDFIALTLKPAFETWGMALTELETLREQRVTLDQATVEADARRARRGLLGVAAVALLAGIAAAWWIPRSVVRPVRSATALADRVAHGDLSQHIQTGQSGEVGALLDALSTMQQGLRHLVQEVQTTSEGISLASAEVASGNVDLSNRTERTAGDLQATSATLQQLTHTAQHTASAAQEATRLAQATSEAARHGRQVMSQLASSIDSIQVTSGRIAEITGLIDGIAYQTNLLALNASVEAARAGEQGRGFAVVANEVRLLANRCAEAAQEIKGLIAHSTAAIEGGGAQAGLAVAAMDKILSHAGTVSATVSEIQGAQSRQSQELSQVSAAVARLDDMTQQNAALVEEGSAAAQSLRDETTRLQALVRQFIVAPPRPHEQPRAPGADAPCQA